MHACFEKDDSRLPLPFFCLFSDARVMITILRRAFSIGCELGFSCMCVCVCVCVTTSLEAALSARAELDYR